MQNRTFGAFGASAAAAGVAAASTAAEARSAPRVMAGLRRRGVATTPADQATGPAVRRQTGSGPSGPPPVTPCAPPANTRMANTPTPAAAQSAKLFPQSVSPSAGGP